MTHKAKKNITVVGTPEFSIGTTMKLREKAHLRGIADDYNIEAMGYITDVDISKALEGDTVVLFSHAITPEATIRLFKESGVHLLNLHPSSLPAYKGIDPVGAQILAGLRNSVMTLQTVAPISKGIDTGDILATVPYSLSWNSRFDIVAAVCNAGADAILSYVRSDLLPNTSKYSSAMHTFAQGDQRTAEEVLNAQRYALWHNKKLKIDDVGYTLEPWHDGRVAYYTNQGLLLTQYRDSLIVLTKDEPLWVVSIQSAGGIVMTASEWLRGNRTELPDTLVLSKETV